MKVEIPETLRVAVNVPYTVAPDPTVANFSTYPDTPFVTNHPFVSRSYGKGFGPEPDARQ